MSQEKCYKTFKRKVSKSSFWFINTKIVSKLCYPLGKALRLEKFGWKTQQCQITKLKTSARLHIMIPLLTLQPTAV